MVGNERILSQEESSPKGARCPVNYSFDTGKSDTPEGLYRFDAVADFVVEDFDSITDEHIEAYHALGYLVVEKAFPQSMVDDALAGLLALINGERADFTGIQFEAWAKDRLDRITKEEKQDYVRKIAWFVNYDERLKAMSEYPPLIRTIERMLGDRPKLFQDMALIKPPGGGREKPWHQDKAYFDIRLEDRVVGAWIALDEATAENGCMHVIPCSHKEGAVVHFKRRDWQICDTDVKVEQDVMVPLKPGGCLLFDGLIHHGTPPNYSKKRRRALQFHYAGESAMKVSTAERLAIFGSEGKDVTC